MPTIKTYNNIAQKGLDHFGPGYEVSPEAVNEDAILVRSANLHDLDYNDNLKAIARAGAGVNNIDIDACTEKGIVVFNTPGANANAVKELALAGLLLASRDIYHGIEWSKEQKDNENLSKETEQVKKLYGGNEIAGKTLGVIGLGAIGNKISNACLRLGMQVLGYDPYMSVESAWALSRWVTHKDDLKSLLGQSDFITLHLPELDSTRGMINKETIAQMKDGVKIINYARGGLVNEDDMLEALDSGKVALYVTDFPSRKLVSHPKVITTPHLGASTAESEENCAVQAVDELIDYLERGNITHSVNMPAVSNDMLTPYRVTIIHDNKPNMLAFFAQTLGNEDRNLENMINKSKGDIAYTLIDMTQKPSQQDLATLSNYPGVRRLQLFENKRYA